jgi:carboxylesterase
MDASATAPFRLEPKDSSAKAAVLLLHGFTGSPWEVRPVGESLAARGYHVLAPRLPGHGTTPEAMLYVSHLEWEHEAEAALKSLQGFERVYVAGLSMGALLGLLLAARFPWRVQALALIAPAMRLQSRGAAVLRALRVLKRHPFDEIWVRKTSSDIEDVNERAQSPVLPRYPAARLRDLFALQELAARAVGQVRAPAFLAVSEHDHVVSVPAVRSLHQQLSGSRLLLLQRGFHIIPRDLERARLNAELGAFFDAQR